VFGSQSSIDLAFDREAKKGNSMKKTDERKMKFLFTRLFFSGLFSQDYRGRLRDFIHRAPEERKVKGKYIWSFGDVGQMTIDGYLVYFGRLGKSIKEKYETIYDEKRHSFRRELITTKIAVYSNFFIFPDFSILAYEPRPSIGRFTFQRQFKDFWTKICLCDIVFEFLKDEREFFDKVAQLEKILHASFSVRPSNPKVSDIWKPLDDDLKDGNIRSLRLRMDNEEGLNTQGRIFREASAMAVDGYGEGEVTGVKGSLQEKVRIGSVIIEREKVTIDDPKKMTPEMIEMIKEILKVQD